MMLNIVECLKMKDYFYNLGEYIEHEVLIVFPMHEFQIYMKIWKIGLRLSKILLHWNLIHKWVQPILLGISPPVNY